VDKIDITMTATLRPEIITRTLDSILNCVIGRKTDRFRLILNIDRIGDKVKPKEIIRPAAERFKDLIFNIADSPSFPKAVKWVWSQATARFIFHIEDDWIFSRKIEVDDMIRILDKYEEVSSLRLSKYNTRPSEVIKQFECKWRYNEDGFYIADRWEKQFGLNPILIKKQFIDEALPRMVDHVNPEKQFRMSQEYMVPVIKKWKYGLYTTPGAKALVTDIGRDWSKPRGFLKPKSRTFLTWVKNDK
jgi:hypothetical protein